MRTKPLLEGDAPESTSGGQISKKIILEGDE